MELFYRFRVVDNMGCVIERSFKRPMMYHEAVKKVLGFIDYNSIETELVSLESSWLYRLMNERVWSFMPVKNMRTSYEYLKETNIYN